MGDQVSKETYIELLKRYAAIKADRDRMGRALEWYESASPMEFIEDAGKRAREALGDE